MVNSRRQVAAQAEIARFERGLFLDEEVEVFAAGCLHRRMQARRSIDGRDRFRQQFDHLAGIFGSGDSLIVGDVHCGADCRGASLDGDFRFFEQFDHRRIQFGADVPSHGRFRRDGVGDAGIAVKAGRFDAVGFIRIQAQGVDRSDRDRGGVNRIDAEMGAGAVGRHAVKHALQPFGSGMIQGRDGLGHGDLFAGTQMDTQNHVHIVNHAGFDHGESAGPEFLRRLKNDLQFAGLDGAGFRQLLRCSEHHGGMRVVAAGMDRA